MNNTLNNTPDTTLNTNAAPADAVTTQFNVSELEPRLENSVWDKEPAENPTGGTGHY